MTTHLRSVAGPLLRTGAGLLEDFAKLIGVAPRHAEAALYSDRAARATLAACAPGQALSRRGMFGASAALAAGIAFGFPAVSRRWSPLWRMYRVTTYINGESYSVFEIPLKPGKVLYFDTDSVFLEV